MTLEALEDKRAQLEKDENNFLRSRGWRYQCDFPGGLWLWCKEVKSLPSANVSEGRLIAVEKSTALWIEERI